MSMGTVCAVLYRVQGKCTSYHLDELKFIGRSEATRSW